MRGLWPTRESGSLLFSSLFSLTNSKWTLLSQPEMSSIRSLRVHAARFCFGQGECQDHRDIEILIEISWATGTTKGMYTMLLNLETQTYSIIRTKGISRKAMPKHPDGVSSSVQLLGISVIKIKAASQPNLFAHIWTVWGTLSQWFLTSEFRIYKIWTSPEATPLLPIFSSSSPDCQGRKKL